MTKQQRRKLLDALTFMVLSDFGEAFEDEQFNPFDPADVARQAVISLQAVYEEFEDGELEDYNELADQVVQQWREGNIDLDSDNLAVPS